MRRQTTETKTDIAFSLWLIFARSGTVRATRTAPNLDRGERAMALSIVLPKSLWSTPALRATIEVPEVSAPPPTVDIRAAADALKTVLGVDIDVRLVAHQEGVEI